MSRTIPHRRLTRPDFGNPCINEVRLDRDRFACVADDGRVRVGTIAEGRLRLDGVWTADGLRVLSNAVARRGDTVVIGTHEHRVVQFCDHDGVGTQTVATPLGLGPINTLEICRTGDVLVGTYSGALATVGPDGDVRSIVELRSGAIKAIALDPDEGVVIAGTANGTIARVDLADQVVEPIACHAGIVNDIATSVDGTVVTSVSRDFTVRRTRVADGTVLADVDLPRRSPKAVVDIGSGVVVVGDYWGGILVVDTSDGAIERHPLGANGISSLALAPGGVLASSYDGSLTLLAPQTGQLIDCIRFMTQKPAAAPTHEEAYA